MPESSGKTQQTAGDIFGYFTGIHQQRIKKFFKDRHRFEGGEKISDRPLVLMAFTNRCGSNLTASYLREANVVRGLGEYLNYDMVIRHARNRNFTAFPDYVGWLHARKTRKGGVFGTKASGDQISLILRWGIDRMFSGLRIIHVVREDVVAQAVSYSIASQTQRWTSNQRGLDVEPVFDPEDIFKRMQAIMRTNEKIQLIAEIAGIPRLIVSYGDIVRQPKSEIERICTFLEVPAPASADITPQIERQSTGLNAEFRASFLRWCAEKAELNPPQP